MYWRMPARKVWQLLSVLAPLICDKQGACHLVYPIHYVNQAIECYWLASLNSLSVGLDPLFY